MAGCSSKLRLHLVLFTSVRFQSTAILLCPPYPTLSTSQLTGQQTDPCMFATLNTASKVPLENFARRRKREAGQFLNKKN